MVDSKKIWKIVGDYCMLSLGTLIFVLGWTSFMIPSNIASGGLIGMCAIIQYATFGLIKVAYSFPIINGILIIVGSLILGKGFGFRTIFVIALSSLLFEVMPQFEFLKCLPDHPLYLDDKILVPIIGGLMEAIGIGIVISYGGSSGGSDIVAIVVNKFWPVSLGTVFIFCDVFVIASILLVPGKTFQDMMYGYVAMVVFSVAIDLVTTGRKSNVQVLIFSNHYQEIADYIMNDLKRGVTALNAIGWYTKEDKRVLLVVVRKRELRNVTRAVKLVDPKAFMSVSQASGVYGEGFEEMKAGIQKKSKKKIQ